MLGVAQLRGALGRPPYLAPLAVCLLLGCARSESGPRPTGTVAARAFNARGFRWRVIELPEQGLRLYMQRHTAADESSDAIVDSVVRAQNDVLALVEEPAVPTTKVGPREGRPPGEAALFFLGSRAEMQRLSGRPLSGFVQPGEATAFFVSAPGYRAPLRHELAHLYTLERWGRPAAGEAATWLVEGLGAWAGGPCQGQSPDALAAGLLLRGALPPVAELAARFRALPEEVAMPAAGSLIQFLYTHEGISGLRGRWHSELGRALPDSATEAAWRAYVGSVRPGALDITRVMQEGC